MPATSARPAAGSELPAPAGTPSSRARRQRIAPSTHAGTQLLPVACRRLAGLSPARTSRAAPRGTDPPARRANRRRAAPGRGPARALRARARAGCRRTAGRATRAASRPARGRDRGPGTGPRETRSAAPGRGSRSAPRAPAAPLPSRCRRDAGRGNREARPGARRDPVDQRHERADGAVSRPADAFAITARARRPRRPATASGLITTAARRTGGARPGSSRRPRAAPPRPRAPARCRAGRTCASGSAAPGRGGTR